MKDPAWAGRQINPVKATVAVTEKEMQERNGEHFMGRGNSKGGTTSQKSVPALKLQ
jgi:hypothetical protein